VLIATGHRAEKTAIRLLKKAPWMSRFMSGDHWKIVVKTQWTNVEQHFQLRCGYFHGFHQNEKLVQISECLILQGAGGNNAGHGRMLVRQLDDTRVTPGWIHAQEMNPTKGETRLRLAELLFWEWPPDNRVGNQHVKFFLARHAVDGLVVHRTSSQSYKDVNNLFLFAMRAGNGNF
jgi:hypothetical protein